MDQRERIGDFQEGLRAAIKGFLDNVWTAMPGIVDDVNLEQMTVKVQVAITEKLRDATGVFNDTVITLLADVPIVFPCAGNFAITFPIAPGDEVLVVFAKRCIDAWWQNGGVQNQSEIRSHHLSDGFAIPGPQSLARVLTGISATNLQIRSRDGATRIEITPAGVVNIVAPGGVNITGNLVVSGTVTTDGITSDSDVAVTGDLTVSGTTVGTGEGTFNGHTVSAHKHGGVTTGSGDTGLPIG